MGSMKFPVSSMKSSAVWSSMLHQSDEFVLKPAMANRKKQLIFENVFRYVFHSLNKQTNKQMHFLQKFSYANTRIFKRQRRCTKDIQVFIRSFESNCHFP